MTKLKIAFIFLGGFFGGFASAQECISEKKIDEL